MSRSLRCRIITVVSMTPAYGVSLPNMIQQLRLFPLYRPLSVLNIQQYFVDIISYLHVCALLANILLHIYRLTNRYRDNQTIVEWHVFFLLLSIQGILY